MLSLPTSVRIYLARGATDMRKSIDGLAAVTKEVLQHDPLSGHLFVFCNRRRDRIKILYWERSGFWLLHKRLACQDEDLVLPFPLARSWRRESGPDPSIRSRSDRGAGGNLNLTHPAIEF